MYRSSNVAVCSLFFQALLKLGSMCKARSTKPTKLFSKRNLEIRSMASRSRYSRMIVPLVLDLAVKCVGDNSLLVQLARAGF